jgi:uncharacterized iron-regulated membrane protein
LHLVQVGDADATTLYVSAVTGEIVRDATRNERIWNWVGAWIHWLYPFRGGVFDKQHTSIVVYTSLLATLLAISGMLIGLLRWRFKGAYSSTSRTPYRDFVMRWHHLLGLAFGLITVTWIFSGMMSMNPWKIFDSGMAPLDLQAFQGGNIDAGHFSLDYRQLLERCADKGVPPRELELRMFDGQGYVVEFSANGGTHLTPVANIETSLAMLPFDQLQAAGARLIPTARVLQAEMLQAYDFYYYARAPHTMTGHLEKRLPVLRMKFDDIGSTWVHLDPYTGEVLGKVDSHRRASRWLFAFLHSWDWLPLLNRRPLWDAVLLLMSIGGFLISMTGIVIGWRRLTGCRKQGSPCRTPH